MSETRIPEALALLREKGWCKGRFDDGDARCINGALLAVWGVECAESVSHHGFVPDHAAIRRAVGLTGAHGGVGVAAWNDDPATTFADVEFVLEKAILERGGAL